MISTGRASFIALLAFVAGGVVVYAYTALQPAPTATHAAAGKQPSRVARRDLREGLQQMDAAGKAIGRRQFQTAASALTQAQVLFADLETRVGGKHQPILATQEAVLIHEFTPRHGEDARLMQGRSTLRLTLRDYAVRFGDLRVNNNALADHLEQAIGAVRNQNGARAVRELSAARSAITFQFNGDEPEET